MRLAILLAFACAVAPQLFAANQNVRFIVHAPDSAATDNSIYLAGSLADVGTWKPDGVKLTRQPDGTYSAEVTLPLGQTLEYKITRGTWPTVEKNADGSDRPNRSLAIGAGTHQIEITVDRWANGDPATQVPSTVV